MTKFSSLILGLALAGAAGTASAQTTAMDWTKTDCNTGASHNLFATLDSGFVIIQEYVMLGGCQPCITAGNVLKSIHDDFQFSHPGKVRVYQTAFDNTSSCADMATWGSTNGFGHATQFAMGGAEVSHYGGMGMPTVVVMGGDAHSVFYKKKGSVSSSTEQTALTAAIDQALIAAQGTADKLAIAGLDVYPSPAMAGGSVRVSAQGGISRVEVVSLMGQSIASQSFGGGAGVVGVAVPQVATGMYLLRVTDAAGKVGTRKLVIENN